MNNIFHEGEYHIQETMGVRKDSDALSSMIQNKLPFIAKGFLRELKFCVLTLSIKEDDIYSATVYNDSGFIDILDDSTILINLNKKSYIPPSYLKNNDLTIGFLGIDFEQAMRIRVNGKAKILNNKILLSINEAYANCPKYIKKRIHVESKNKPLFQHIIKNNTITKEFKDVLSNTDTFFLASLHKKKGADISHKGGKEGFVKVISSTKLQFTDMPGNNLFNSLGNIHINSSVNLLFIDFINNDTYLFIGNASIIEVSKKNRKTFEVTIECKNIVKNTNGFLQNYNC